MTDRDRTNDDQQTRRQGEPHDAQQSSTKGKDIMRGRSFAGANIANTERGQTLERQRVVDHHGENLDEINEVTDAEIEARERERNED
jgi:hypothetical protein